MYTGRSERVWRRLQLSKLSASVDAVASVLQQWHPDRHRGDDLAKRRFQQIQEAYEVLMDTGKRQSYDLKLVHLLPLEVGSL